MKRSMIAVLACTAMMAMSACSKNKNNGQVPVNQEPPQAAQGPAYKVSLTSKCADESVDYCVGQYGFAVSAEGNFEMGPGPAGQRKSGQITDDELKMLGAAVLGAIGGFDAARAESCAQAPVANSEDKVIISMKDGDLGVIRTSGSDLCFQTATFEQAEALHKAIRHLADKYYSVPFPDACAEAIQGVEALYTDMQKCSVDTDCTYVTTEYDVIPPGSHQFVTTDACSNLKPLVVGNLAAIVRTQGQAYELLDQARYVCGERIIRYECTGISGFMSSEGAPVCDTAVGLCKVNPAITTLR